MQTAALQAERTFITGLEIRLSDGPIPGPPPQVTIQAQTGLADLEEPNRWRADLGIVVRPADENRPLPYEIAITVSGVFRVVAEMEPEKARKLAFVNGMSILYSSARETVLLLTGRFPAGPFVLPTLSFVDEYDRLAPLKVAEKPAPYGKRKK
jgi:preprotein translocase subunit SecB